MPPVVGKRCIRTPLYGIPPDEAFYYPIWIEERHKSGGNMPSGCAQRTSVQGSERFDALEQLRLSDVAVLGGETAMAPECGRHKNVEKTLHSSSIENRTSEFRIPRFPEYKQHRQRVWLGAHHQKGLRLDYPMPPSTGTAVPQASAHQSNPKGNMRKQVSSSCHRKSLHLARTRTSELLPVDGVASAGPRRRRSYPQLSILCGEGARGGALSKVEG
ncbi:hypothetical protein C8Q78DRAFT_995407 [Trametes maxima]|nr:hypothetical protein C8Q78DRAFT_995407 [Trametes maxima]